MTAPRGGSGAWAAAALAGAATGLRSTAALTALVDAGAPGLPRALSSRPARGVALLGTAAELVIDKLPSTPSRLEPRGLAARVLFAGAAGAVVARGAGRPAPGPALVASATALVSARVGHDLRVAFAERLPPLAVAATEDALALALGRACSRG